MFCRIVRWFADRRVADGQPLAGWQQRHVAACPDCQRVVAAERRLVAELREPAFEPIRASTTLRARILDRLHAPPVPVPIVPAHPALRWSLATAGLGVAAALLLALALLQRTSARQTSSTSNPPTVVLKAPAAPAPLASQPPSRTILVPPTAALARSSEAVEHLASGFARQELSRLAEGARATGEVLIAKLSIDDLLMSLPPQSAPPSDDPSRP
ncbi:MAG: hypothetical protein PHU85_08835 [Phycisphaerae bacterium]|nr:hypothetical protein [Phycisphaerae bacterium]